MKNIIACLIIGSLLTGSLSGCVGAVLVGGAAAGAAVAHDRRSAGTIVDDQSIEMKISYDLENNASVPPSSHINVTSYNYAVLLTGEVPTEQVSELAENTARQTNKVDRVYNELAISPSSSLGSTSTDAWITTKVKAALVHVDGLPEFDPSQVKVVTERGVVYLFGLLTPAEAEATTNTARRVDGVQKVVTLFEYVPATPPTQKSPQTPSTT